MLAPRAYPLSESSSSIVRILRRESLTLLFLTFVGTVILPITVYFVGFKVFGDYAGAGLGGFFRDIHSDARDGQPVVIFLLLSPYLIWQLLRLSFYVFRRFSPNGQERHSQP